MTRDRLRRGWRVTKLASRSVSGQLKVLGLALVVLIPVVAAASLWNLTSQSRDIHVLTTSYSPALDANNAVLIDMTGAYVDVEPAPGRLRPTDQLPRHAEPGFRGARHHGACPDLELAPGRGPHPVCRACWTPSERPSPPGSGRQRPRTTACGAAGRSARSSRQTRWTGSVPSATATAACTTCSGSSVTRPATGRGAPSSCSSAPRPPRCCWRWSSCSGGGGCWRARSVVRWSGSVRSSSVSVTVTATPRPTPGRGPRRSGRWRPTSTA